MLNGFRKYLEDENLVPRTVDLQEKHVMKWLKWLNGSVEESTYQDLMDYIAHLQAEEKTIYHINKSLQSISHYYEYQELPNIAISTRLRGRIAKVPLRPIKAEKIDALYACFEVMKVQNKVNYFHYSDKILLGLMMYQALEMGDFMVLKKDDIDLEQGTIYVPSRKARLSRTIALQSHQILQLHQYITSDRPASQRLWKTHKDIAEPLNSDKLFSPQVDDYNQLHWQFKRLSKHVKSEAKNKLDLHLEKLNHLRQSRIAIWIKQYGLRKTQYLAGFRTVMSAERYQTADLEDLKGQVKKYHPW